jgi:hypothetical protein
MFGGASRGYDYTGARVSRIHQSGSETQTTCAGLAQIDGRGASHGIRITCDASQVIRMRSMVAGGGGSGIVSRPRAHVSAPLAMSVLPVSPKWLPRERHSLGYGQHKPKKGNSPFRAPECPG